MTELNLSVAQTKILRRQAGDELANAPILADFQMLLQFLGGEGVAAAGKYNLLPIAAIDALDRQLTRPLWLNLKRPQLRSHPYLQGLHLLLRATGLGRVDGIGDKARLVLDPLLNDQWNRLNPTERYFTLLEAWLRVARPEMIGERGSSFFEGYLHPCLEAWSAVKGKRRFNTDHRYGATLPGLWREYCHLALMDLFGLMQLHPAKEAVHPWCPASVERTPFGDAVFTVLDKAFGGLRRFDRFEDNRAEPVAFGHWQPLFQPYFPDWVNNLVISAAKTPPGLYVFRVSLGKIWRLIAVPSGCTLDHFVDAILESVDFDDDHLYAFTYRDRFGASVEVNHPEIEEGPWTNEVRIGKLGLNVGQTMELEYDFGDSWKFKLRLERIDPLDKNAKKPRILESHGKAPEQYPQWDDE